MIFTATGQDHCDAPRSPQSSQLPPNLNHGKAATDRRPGQVAFRANPSRPRSAKARQRLDCVVRAPTPQPTDHRDDTLTAHPAQFTSV